MGLKRFPDPEWALLLSREEGLEQGASPWEVAGESHRITRLYFGNEFCQERIPSEKFIEHALTMARKLDLAFSLLTPYATSRGLRRIENLFDFLAKDHPGTEVIVNDWGVLNLLRRKHPDLKPSLGRILTKLIRRFPDVLSSHHPLENEAASSAMKRPVTSFPPYRRFLEGLGVQRVELDYPPQGLDLEGITLPISLYLPYGYLTTGMSCLIGSLDLLKANKFSPSAPCQGQCRLYFSELSSSTFSAAGHGLQLFQGGNTVFYRHSPAMIQTALNLAHGRKGMRIVFQPRIPI